MRKAVLYIVFILVSVHICVAQSPEMTEKANVIFSEKIHDFGKIPYKGDAEHRFVFRNISDSAFLITNVKAKCGCTSTDWTQEPVPERKKGYISIVYDTKRVGQFSKSVYVYNNQTRYPIQLVVRGKVMEPPEGSKDRDAYMKKQKKRGIH